MGIPESQTEVLFASKFEVQDEDSSASSHPAPSGQTRLHPGPSNPGTSNRGTPNCSSSNFHRGGNKSIETHVNNRYQPY